MNKNYTPPVASSEEEFVTPPTPEEEEAFFNEFIRPRLAFWQKLLIYVTVWFVLIFAACGIMWSVMQQYEAAQPWYAVEKHLSTAGQKAFYTALVNAYGENVNSYESLYDIASELSQNYTGKISYKKLIREYTYDNPVYLLYSGDENLLKLTLRLGEKTGFAGIVGYSVKNVELVSSDLIEFKNYPLVYPKNAVVKINGKMSTPTQTDDYKVFGSEDFNVCMLENLILPPSVKIVLDNQELSPIKSGSFVYDYPEAKLSTITVTVPEEATVIADGKILPTGFKGVKKESAPDRFGYTVSVMSYDIPTVAGEIDISAVKSGKHLSLETNENVYTFSDDPISASIVVPSGATLYANGNEIDVAEGNEGALWRADFEGVAGVSTATEYVFENICQVPEFSAKLGDTELTAATDDEKTVFLMPSSDELKEQYTDEVINFMKAYLYYTTQGMSNTRRNLNAVKALVAAPSPLYTNLERSYIGYYYIAAQKMTVDYMEVDNFIPYGDNAFTCELSYRINLKNWVGEAIDENTMRIAFAKRGNTFLPVNMLLAGN